MNKSSASQLTAADGTDVPSVEVPILRAESGIARVWLQDGTTLELTLHITGVQRAIIEHSDSFEIVHGITYDDHLETSGPPPEVVTKLSTDLAEAPAAITA